MNLSKLWELVMDREAWRAAVLGVTVGHNWVTELTELMGQQEIRGKKKDHCQGAVDGDIPGGPVAKTPHSQCRGPGFEPWLENWIPLAATKNSHTTIKDPAGHSEDQRQCKPQKEKKKKAAAAVDQLCMMKGKMIKINS